MPNTIFLTDNKRLMKKQCEVVDCNETAEFYDPMDNALCADHMEQDIDEKTYDRDEFEPI